MSKVIDMYKIHWALYSYENEGIKTSSTIFTKKRAVKLCHEANKYFIRAEHWTEKLKEVK